MSGEVAIDEDEGLGSMSLEELLEVRVVSASRTEELLAEAPATVIVLGRADLEARGYSELSEILDDLPGMDVVRPYGATYFKNYWRGYRNTIGDPFLVMVDGLVFNHLYFNTADILTTFPLSNIERVEVVYGPASVVYGPNAFMGVIHVITRQDAPPGTRIQLAGGTAGRRLADVSYSYRNGTMGLAIAARVDNGELEVPNEAYEYTRSVYYSDPRLWGGFTDNPKLGGAFSSAKRNRSLDLRAHLGSLEIGLQYFRLDAGYGLEYAADRAQNEAVWARPELSLHLRDRQTLGGGTLTSLLRYRKSDVSNDSYFVESTPGSAADPEQHADFSYWQALNSSWSLFEDLEIPVSDALSLALGIKYEQKDLQRAYDINYGPSLPAGDIDARDYPYPEPPGDTPRSANRITTEDSGAYMLARYRAGKAHQLHLGVRADHNSEYGSATTLRAGYVGTYGRWGMKALFGQAFQEPNPRLLYGGWDGSGSDPTIDPERSSTIEIGGRYTQPTFNAEASAYYVRNEGTFVNTASRALNLGDRRVLGCELQARVLLPAPRIGRLEIDRLETWGYYSRILDTDEERFDDIGEAAGSGEIGDLARDKLHFGITATPGKGMTATLRGRYIGERPTVESNPVRRVPSYLSFDAFLRYDGPFAKGLGISLSATNLTDENYAHPGVRDANAGIDPGSFDDQGLWHGSQGFYNSLLPQPGRELLLSVHLSM